MAEREGFEPSVPLPARRISSAVLSTTQPPLRIEKKAHPLTDGPALVFKSAGH